MRKPGKCSACRPPPQARVRHPPVGCAKASVGVLIVGNSVARSGNFATTRVAVSALNALYPHRSFEYETMGSHVGESSHALHVLQGQARSKWAKVELVLLQHVGLISYVRRRIFASGERPRCRPAPRSQPLPLHMPPPDEHP